MTARSHTLSQQSAVEEESHVDAGQPKTDTQENETTDSAGADVAHTDHLHAQLAAEENTEARLPEIELRALGNTKPDIDIRAIQDHHGRWHWLAYSVDDDGYPIAQSCYNASSETQLVTNLRKVFSDTNKVVALRRTGDEKARRLD